MSLRPPSPSTPGQDTGTPAPDAVPWRWWDAIITYALVFVVGGTALALVLAVVPPDAREGVALGGSAAALVLLTPAWIAVRYRPALGRLFGRQRPRPTDVAVGIAAGLGAFVAFNLLLSAALSVLAESVGLDLPPVQQQLQEAARDPASAPYVVVGVVLFAPLGEEMLFRGVLFQALRQRLGLWPGAGISGLVFGLAHGIGESGPIPVAVIVTTLLGVLLALLFHRRGTLVAPVLTHAAFNAVTIGLVVAGVG